MNSKFSFYILLVMIMEKNVDTLYIYDSTLTLYT